MKKDLATAQAEEEKEQPAIDGGNQDEEAVPADEDLEEAAHELQLQIAGLVQQQEFGQCAELQKQLEVTRRWFPSL